MFKVFVMVGCNGGGSGAGSNSGGNGGNNQSLSVVYSGKINQDSFYITNGLDINFNTGQVFIPINSKVTQSFSSPSQFSNTALANINGAWQATNFALPNDMSGGYDTALNQCNVASNNDIACIYTGGTGSIIKLFNPSSGAQIATFNITDNTYFQSGNGYLNVTGNYYIDFYDGL